MNDDKTTKTIQVSDHFSAPADRVFDAWLDPSRAGAWLFATPTGKNVRCEIDARPSGGFVITDRRDGEDVEHVGTFLDLQRPHRLAFTFGVPKYSSLATRVSIEIEPRGPAACELTLRNEGVLEEWAASTEDGWRSILSALDHLLGTPDETARTIIALERAALDRWGQGDPDGFLELSDAEVVYFDPFVPARVDSKAALRTLYDAIRGQVLMTSYDLVAPRVQLCGDMAVLTFNLVSHAADGDMRWNTTEVYRRRAGEWRIIHTHWSLTQPKIS